MAVPDQAVSSFADLLRPLTEAEFFGQHYEQQALHIHAADRDRFEALRASINLEEVLHLSCRSWGAVSLAGEARLGAPLLDTSSPPDPDRVFEAFAQGRTIVVNDLQAKNLAVARLCRLVEARLMCRANVNLYLTSAQTPGLARHYDDDDVLVLQLEGEKTWRTWPTEDRLPLGDTPYVEPCPAVAEQVHRLLPGDLLYVPRGAPHAARSGATDSLHLTVSLNVFRMVHLVRDAVSVAAAYDPSLRRAAPVETVRGAGAWDAATLLEEAARVLRRHTDGSEEAAARTRARLLAGIESLPRLLKTTAPQRVTAETRVGINENQLWGLRRSDGGVLIECTGTTFEVPLPLARIAPLLQADEPFCASDLEEVVSIDHRVAMLQAMVDSRFLRVIDPVDAAVGVL